MDRLTATNRLNDGGRMIVENPQASELYAPLTHSIIPQRGVGAVSYTRATIATVTDHEWVIRQCLSGEARFLGARRVRNLHTYSEDITNAAWSPSSCTRTKNAWIAPDGTITSWLVTSNVATALTEFNQNYDIVSGQTYILSVSLKANGWLQYVQLVWNSVTFWFGYINVDLSNGTITANVPWAANMQATITPEANWFYRIQLKATAISTLANNHLSVAMISSGTSIRIATFPWDGIKWFYYWHPQFEDVTGQSIQTAAEYVSTNVLVSPFHGAMVDGVKYFDTDINGNQLSPDGYLAEGVKTNLFTDSEDFSLWTKAGTWVITPNATIAPDGRMTADLFTLSTSNESQWVTKVITTTAVIYWDSIYVKPNGHYYIQFNASYAISTWFVNFDLLNWVVGSSSLWTWRIEALKDGWFRLKVTTWTVTATSNNVSFAFCQSATSARGSVVQGTWSSWVYLWWAQLEVWASSSYISSALVTRNDDILEYSLVNLQSTKWAVYAETTNYFTSTNIAVLWLTGSSCRVLWSSGISPSFYFGSSTLVSVNDGTNTVPSSNSVSSSQYNRVIWKYSGSSEKICLNGTLTSGAFDGTTSYTNLCIGNSTANTRWLYGSIRNLQIWDYEISDAEAVALTTI